MSIIWSTLTLSTACPPGLCPPRERERERERETEREQERERQREREREREKKTCLIYSFK